MFIALLIAAAATAPAAAPARPFKLKGRGHQVTYEYAWPAEARAIPQLHALLRRRMQADRTEILALAREMRGDEWFEQGAGYESTFTYELNGQSDRLLSLTGGHWQFTGGAHGNGKSLALLWDRIRKREISIPDLFERPTEYALLRPRYCDALSAEQRENRGGDGRLRTIDEFDQCPKFSVLTVELLDENHNRRFETLRFTADQYVAGPYAEGPYVVDLPVTARLIAAMKPGYRSSFEAQRQ